MDVDRRRQELRLEHVAELAELVAGALQRLLLRDEIDPLHLRIRGDLVRRGHELLHVGAFIDEGANLHPFLDLLQRVADVQRDESEQAEREQGERDRRYAQQAEQRCAAKGERGVAQGAHQRCPPPSPARPLPPPISRSNAERAASAESKTMRPLSISIVR